MVHNFYQIGGGEHTVFENEVKLLREHGHEVYTYTRSNDELKTSKAKLLLLPLSTIWSMGTYHQIRKQIREKQIDVVHCHNTFPLISPAVYYGARSLKVPVIQTIHNFRLLCPNGIFYCHGKVCEQCSAQGHFRMALKNKCYRNSRLQTLVVVAMLTIHRWLGTYGKIQYIFLTEFNKQKFARLLDITGENVFVKPNYVSAMGHEPVEPEAKTKFVFAGRLECNKGIDFLLETWPVLPEAWELHIYGEGSLRSSCEQAARKHTNIHYYGFQSQNRVFADLAGAQALLFPSDWYEGYPMILAESMAMRIPVVATDCGNHGDLIRSSGGGTVFRCRDVDSFRQAMAEIIKNRPRFSAGACQYYQTHLTPEKNYEKLCEIYEKARHIP